MYQSALKGDLELLSDVVGKKNAEIINNTFAFCDLDGIGEGLLLDTGLPIGAIHKLLASLEIGKRVSEDVARSNPIECSADAYELYRAGLGTAKQEQFLVVCLNSKNQVTAEKMISKGTVNECRVSPLDVLHFAVQECANRIMLFHNHPSGDSTPSPQDIALTKRISAAADVLDITVLDHVVIGRSNYVSFADLGLLVKAELDETVKAIEIDSRKRKAAEKKPAAKKETPKKPSKKKAGKAKRQTTAEFLASRGASPAK